MGCVEDVKNMTYWEYTAAITKLNEWNKRDDEEEIEAPDYDTFQRAQAAIMSDPRLLH